VRNVGSDAPSKGSTGAANAMDAFCDASSGPRPVTRIDRLGTQKDISRTAEKMSKARRRPYIIFTRSAYSVVNQEYGRAFNRKDFVEITATAGRVIRWHFFANGVSRSYYMKQTANFGLLALTAMTFFAAQIATPARAQEHEHAGRPGGRVIDGRGQVLDSRYNHGHYYPALGASVRVLPEGYRPFYFRGSPFYFYGGVWYAPGGPGFLVVRPPFGLVISVLPPYYSTVWIDGLPYYYANDVYYTWDPAQNGYAVVAPPANADQPSSAPPGAPSGAADNLIIYPKNGQTPDRQAADRYECHNWAKGQTGFDPTQPGGGARSPYDRAMAACLTGRGYEVK
jgi:hypothetical protein